MHKEFDDVFEGTDTTFGKEDFVFLGHVFEDRASNVPGTYDDENKGASRSMGRDPGGNIEAVLITILSKKCRHSRCSGQIAGNMIRPSICYLAQH